MARASIDIEQVAAIEILIQGLNAQVSKAPEEIGPTVRHLRMYLDTHTEKYFSLAKEMFSEIDPSIRLSVFVSSISFARLSADDKDMPTIDAKHMVENVMTVDKKGYSWLLKDHQR